MASLNIEFERRMRSLAEMEIERLVNEIAWIDSRLMDLGDSDKDRVEKKLLKLLRVRLMQNLYDLVGFVWEEPEENDVDVSIMSITLEHSTVESVF